MAINLNPGADATLVTAATRAGMAKQLPDYSRTFENVARNYATTMQATTNMWSNIAKVGAAIGDSINKFSEGPQKSQTAEDLLTLPAAQSLKNALEESQAAIAKTFFPGGNKENRAEAVKVRNDLSSTIEHISKHGASIVNAHAHTDLNPGGLVNKDLNEPYDLELSAAYLATVAGETSDLGNYFVLEQDEKTEEWRYFMYHDPSKVKEDMKAIVGLPFDTSGTPGVKGKIMIGDKPLSFSPPEIGKGLILYNVDKNGRRIQGPSRMKKGLEGMFDAAYAGANGQPLLEHQANEISSMIDEFADNPEAWKTRHKFGSDGKSWKEEWTTISETSAKGFGKLGDIVGGINTLDEEQRSDILEGVTDIGGDGITDEDFFGATQQHKDNFAALTLNMFNPGDVNYNAANTGKIFKQSVLERIDAVRVASWNTNPKNPANIKSRLGDGEGLGSITYGGVFEGGSGNDIREEERDQITNIANLMDTRGTIGKGKSAITWDDVRKSYFLADGKAIETKQHLFETLFEEKLTRAFRMSDFYTSITDWDGKKYRKEEEKKEKKFNLFNPYTW